MIALGIALAAVGGFLLAGVFYSVVPPQPTMPGHERPERPFPALAAVELARTGAVAGLVAGLMAAGGFTGPGAGALLGLALWSLPVVLLTGSVFHEGTSARAAVPHAVDWLLKLILVGVVVGLFT